MLGAITGVNLTAYVDLTLFVILAVVICGLVGFARLKLNAHTQAQVYAGFFAGFSLMLALFLI
jgi:membrane-associated phospholipid phosphatase